MTHEGTQACALVVDDDARSLKLMTILLGKAGYRVVTASRGLHGLELLAAEHPDVVLVDLLMPEMDGLEFCRRVRSSPEYAGLPLVLTTAMASSDVEARARQAGVDKMLMKPFERMALLQALEDLRPGPDAGRTDAVGRKADRDD